MRAMADPITAISTRCSASVPIVAPTSSTTLSPRTVGHRQAMAGRSMPDMVFRQIFDIAISAPVLPAEHAGIGLPVADRLDRLPHGRLAPALAHRLARLVVHGHGHGGVADLDAVLEPGLLGDQRRDHRLVAEHQEGGAGMALPGQCRAGHDRGGPVVAAHGVERDAHAFGHVGNGSRGSAGERARPLAGRSPPGAADHSDTGRAGK